MASNRGCFISFEGIDGAGKSAIARLVYDQLFAKGMPVFFVDKNTRAADSAYADQHLRAIREILWDYEPSAPLSVLGDRHWLHLLTSWYCAVQACIVEPLLDRGQIVIADGWYFKYLARFMAKPGALAHDSRECFGRIRAPDAVIILDVEPALAVGRKETLKPSESGALDGLNGDPRSSFIDYQRKVRANLLSLANTDWHLVDATTMPANEVCDLAACIVSTSVRRLKAAAV